MDVTSIARQRAIVPFIGALLPKNVVMSTVLVMHPEYPSTVLLVQVATGVMHRQFAWSLVYVCDVIGIDVAVHKGMFLKD